MIKNGKKILLVSFCVLVILFSGCKKDVDDIPSLKVCDKTEMSELKTVVKSEEQFIDFIRKIIAEMDEADELLSVPNVSSRAVEEATTPESAIQQIDDYVLGFVTAVQECISNIGDIDLDNFDDENFDESDLIEALVGLLNELKFQFSFDKAINIGEIKLSDWIDIVSQALENFYKEFEEEISATVREADLPFDDDADFKALLDEIFDEIPKTKTEIKNEILGNIELAGLKGTEAVEILDQYFVIEKLGMGTKIIFNIDIAKFLKNDADYLKETMINIELNGKISCGVKNLNKLYNLVANSDEIQIPVKGFSIYSDGDFKLSLTTADVKSWVEIVTNDNPFFGLFGGTTDAPTITTALFKGNQSIMFAACTKDGEGGYFTITLNENIGVDEFADIFDTILTEDDDEKIEKELENYLDSAVSVNISVSDGVTEVWTKKYTLKTFSEFIEALEEPEVEA